MRRAGVPVDVLQERLGSLKKLDKLGMRHNVLRCNVTIGSAIIGTALQSPLAHHVPEVGGLNILDLKIRSRECFKGIRLQDVFQYRPPRMRLVLYPC